ncbi:MAG: aminotransferase class V-fold PLP-dependent enzyme [Lachnospiraceae bacterium]
MKQLYEKLEEYSYSDYYPYHMPGHKRQMTGSFLSAAFERDITEIDGFDDLHDAHGAIREAEQRSARLYRSEETHFLINGSTCGILAAIAAVAKKGDALLMGRNCHKAVYHAVLLQELRPVYLYPKVLTAYDLCGGITPEQVEEQLRRKIAVRAVVVTSPSYDGIVSDVEGIAAVVHKYGIPLIVDEAHGAHFGFSDGFPKSSVACGADLVIHSVHKTLPAFTQTALLHVNGTLVDRERLKNYLAVFQSSSPSYLLMAGIDQCMAILENEGVERFRIFESRLQDFYVKACEWKHLELVSEERIIGADGIFAFDKGKLIISTKRADISGRELYRRLLENYHLQAEMAAGSYCLMIMTIMDTEEGFTRLSSALFQIDRELHLKEQKEAPPIPFFRNQVFMEAYKAVNQPKKAVCLADSIGETAAKFVFLYPPGIPLIVPGEEITEIFINHLLRYADMGLHICGLQSEGEKKIEVIWEKSITSSEKAPQEKIPFIKEY